MSEAQGEEPKAAQSNEDRQQQLQKQKENEETMKNTILSQVLTQEARARLGNIKAANVQKGTAVENMIVNMARFGQLGGKLDDEQLKSLLQKVSEQQSKTQTTVKFSRRCDLDSDED